MGRTTRLLHAGALAAVGVLLGLVAGTAFLLADSRTMVLAGHDAVVRPVLGDHAVVHTGPLLPDLRLGVGGPVGVDIDLGATEVASAEEMVERYAFIATEPDTQIDKVRGAVVDMLVSAAVRGIAIGAVPVVFWLLLGPRRRAELLRGLRRPVGVLAGVGLLLIPVLVWQPWLSDDERTRTGGEWVDLQDFLGSGVPVPAALADLEIRESTTTEQTKRLVLSAVDTYDRSKKFYSSAALAAEELDLRQPEADETVAALVSDRHDNIGMDPVARAIADRAGATAVLNAGDDTSTGQSWEEFSLESVSSVFADFDRWAVAGNHDHGTFVPETLTAAGWVMPAGEVVEGPGGGLLLGIDDPRSSGLGNWRDESGTSFADVAAQLADTACASAEPIGTLLVHDANLGRVALERGCVDLVVGGHTHVLSGPDEVVADSGAVGYTFTNGTTGGAAYAIAIGSKPRRDAHVSLVTYREGRPVGLQWVQIRTNGTFEVSPWTEIFPHAADESPDDRRTPLDARGRRGGDRSGAPRPQ
jgi:predicted phosphodiesterase